MLFVFCCLFLNKDFFFHWPHLLVAPETQLTGNSVWLVCLPMVLEIKVED